MERTLASSVPRLASTSKPLLTKSIFNPSIAL